MEIDLDLPAQGERPWGGKLNAAVAKLEEAMETLTEVAWSGDYQDLSNKPDVGSLGAEPAGLSPATKSSLGETYVNKTELITTAVTVEDQNGGLLVGKCVRAIVDTTTGAVTFVVQDV